MAIVATAAARVCWIASVVAVRFGRTAIVSAPPASAKQSAVSGIIGTPPCGDASVTMGQSSAQPDEHEGAHYRDDGPGHEWNPLEEIDQPAVASRWAGSDWGGSGHVGASTEKPIRQTS